MKQNKQEQWIDKFDDLFIGLNSAYNNNNIDEVEIPIKKFISNLLSQSRQEVVKEERKHIFKILDKHINWKPTEGYGSEEELGFQKGLIAEAKLIEREYLKSLSSNKG